MKPSASGALITEATVWELHEVTPVAEMGGVAQMEAKYELYQNFKQIKYNYKCILAS